MFNQQLLLREYTVISVQKIKKKKKIQKLPVSLPFNLRAFQRIQSSE